MSEVIERTDEQIRELTVLNSISDKDMRTIAASENAYEAALLFAQETFGEVRELSDELGNGFALIEDKSKLEGIGMLVLNWRFNEGDFGMFASVAAVTEKNDKVIFNDGSTGIYSQLRTYTDETGHTGGLKARHGLRGSSYDTCINCNRGKPKSLIECTHCGDDSDKRSSSTTYYFDVSA